MLQKCISYAYTAHVNSMHRCMGRRSLRTLHACVILCVLGLITTDIQCKPRNNGGAEQRQGSARALLGSLTQLGSSSEPSSPTPQQEQPSPSTDAAKPQATELSQLLEKLSPWEASVNGSWPVGSTLPNISCTPKGIALAVVAVHGDSLWEHMMRWLAVANRNAYAATHGYSVYISAAELHPR
jgi:hypothetical protein